MDEDGRPDDVAHDPLDDRHGMLDLAELDQPRRGAARPGELEVVAVQPDDEHLGLDRAFDLEAVGESRHGATIAAVGVVRKVGDCRLRGTYRS